MNLSFYLVLPYLRDLAHAKSLPNLGTTLGLHES